MRFKTFKNITNGRVRVKFTSGMSANLLPGCEIENVAVANYEEIKGKVFAIRDLTEVNENQRKQKLYD